MSAPLGESHNRVRGLREERAWTQEELARRAGVSRAAVSAIEKRRSSPSVDAALRVARALGRRVDEVFLLEEESAREESSGSWLPSAASRARSWQALVAGRLVHVPLETTALGLLAPDRVPGRGKPKRESAPREAEAARTLVVASCDPAAALLFSEYAAKSGFRPLCLERPSRTALDLLRRGLVHVAGVHLARAGEPDRQRALVRELAGEGIALLPVARWESGIALTRSERLARGALARARLRWIGREEGSGARACQDEVLGARPEPERVASSHRGLVELLRSGSGEAGACLRLVAEEAGLAFVPVRRERYDLCVREDELADPRLAALLLALRSRRYQAGLRTLPGIEPAAEIGECLSCA